jgi:hypothetical protein
MLTRHHLIEHGAVADLQRDRFLLGEFFKYAIPFSSPWTAAYR